VLLEITVGKHGEAKKKERAKRRGKKGKESQKVEKTVQGNEPFREWNTGDLSNVPKSIKKIRQASR
jgi:DUF4097 and DUF4098 domain-containing protein YvlB